MTDDITALRQAQYLVFPSGPVMRVLDALEASQAECARLREMLDRRPAINAGTLDAYMSWSGAVYVSDMQHAALATKETT